MLNNLVDIITSPSLVFPRLKEKPSVLFPLLLILLSTASVQVGYVLLTDPGFLVDQMIEQAMSANPNAPEDQLRQAYENLSPAVMGGIGAASTAVILLLILSLTAVYLNFMGKFSFLQMGFKSWFSLLCWTGIPGLFAALASWVAILSSPNGQLSMMGVNPLSFASLLQLDVSPSSPLGQLNLMQLWSMVLLVLGYQQWTGRSMVASACIALAPSVLLYGIWGLATL